MAATARQRGAALIVVVTLMAVAVILASQVIERLEQDRTRTENVLLMEQGYAYLLSAEALGMRALAEDRASDQRDGAAVDACTEEEWATGYGPLPWDNGVFLVSIQDLQGRFNINNLAVTRDGERVLDRLQVERFKRLLRSTVPEPDAADALAEEAADWLDGNALVDGLGGAEDTEYETYRTGNTPFGNVSELRALRSATAGLWRETDDKPLFSRYITALPESTRVNANTAPPEVLLALAPSLGSAGADAIVAARNQKAFASVDEVMALPELAGLPVAERDELKAAMAVNSEYFQVSAQVGVGGRTLRLVSQVYRPLQQGTPQVVQRDLGQVFVVPETACNPGWTPPEQEKQG